MLQNRFSLQNALLMLLAAGVLTAFGCGQLTDKDRIRIAKVGEQYITRGDLFKLIREMPDTERPMIRSRGDLLRVLNDHIDTRVKLPLGKKLAAEGKVSVDRELAREQYFRESGDQEEQLRAMWRMEVPKSGEITPMMNLYGLTPELLQFNKDSIEEETDRMVEKLQAEQAVEYLAVEAVKAGKITIEEQEIQRDYEFMKEELVTLEELQFIGIRFIADDPEAAAKASAVRDRITAGESFDALAAEYEAKGAADGVQYVFQSGIQNNPALEKFRGFWAAASGAEAESVIGPVYLPVYQQVARDKEGHTRTVDMPAAYIIFKVLEHKPAGILDYERAKPFVMKPLLLSKMMHLLRDERGVEVYQDKLPDPAQMQGPATTL